MNRKGQGLNFLTNAFTGAFVLAITGLVIYAIVGLPVITKIYGAVFSLGEPWQTIVWVFIGILLLAIIARRK